VRWFHDHKRVEIRQHVAVDAHRRREAGTAEHNTVAGRYHLPVTKIGFQPGDDEVQRHLVVNRMAFAPFVRIERFAGRVLGDEVRVPLHVVDLAATEQRQRSVGVHPIGTEFQAG
jgi:hypothetical protein